MAITGDGDARWRKQERYRSLGLCREEYDLPVSGKCDKRT